MSKKVRAVFRADDILQLSIFDEQHINATWFNIPKGDRINILEHEVIFNSVSKDIPEIVTGKTIVIGFSPEISALGLVTDKDFVELQKMLAPKRVVEVETFKLNF